MKGTLIKQHRKFNNMTLEELADGICSVSYLSKIEHDSINASDEIYRLLEQRLNIKLVDINDEFDEDIYHDLLDWHEAAQLQDMDLMKQYDLKYEHGLRKNQNTELNSLYKIVKARHDMKITEQPLSTETVQILESIYPFSNQEFKFFFHKTFGIHYLLKSNLNQALEHFNETNNLLKYVHFEDSETYFHLCMTFSKLRSTASAVESNYYGEKALEGYMKDLNYSRIIDTYLMIAVNYQHLQNFNIAQEYYFKILKVARYHLNSEEKQRIYHNLGYTKANLEQYKEAVYYLEKSREIGSYDMYAHTSTIYLLASTSYYAENIDQSWNYIHEGEKISEENNYAYFKHKFYVLKNVINGTTYDESFISQLEKEIIPDIAKLNEYKGYLDYLEMLGDIYYEKRMYKKAASCYKEANTFKFTQKKDLL